MTADQLTSVLNDRHEAAGAKFAEFGGWLMPLEYTGVLAEHTAVRERVGLFDVSHLGKALVVGPGAADYLNTRLTNDLNRIGAGQAQYTLLCAEDGGRHHYTVVARPDVRGQLVRCDGELLDRTFLSLVVGGDITEAVKYAERVAAAETPFFSSLLTFFPGDER